tara:strand:+ start:272 stop:574 length:303 start_codon:yes stop_codon:yes gene_type:complete
MKFIVFIFFASTLLFYSDSFSTGKSMPTEEDVDLTCLNLSHLENDNNDKSIDILLELGIPPAKMNKALSGATRDKTKQKSSEFRKKCFSHLMAILKKAYE